jgi:hypothetical protein
LRRFQVTHFWWLTPFFFDLSFPAIPARAKLLTITLPGRHLEDPNGDPNSFQVFRFREPEFAPVGQRQQARR